MADQSTGRLLNNWIDSYLEFVDNSEPPISYHYWTAVSTISAVLQRKCWANWGHENIYPNMYIILVGPPGGRKGTAMRVGKKFLSTIGQDIGAEFMTRAAMAKELESFRGEVEVYGMDAPYIHHSLSIMPEELTVLVSDNNPDMIETLTDLFDCPDNWRYVTKHQGKNYLRNVFLNLIGATTPRILQRRLSVDAAGAGLLSRIIFVVEQGRRKAVPLPFLSPGELRLQEDLLHDLEQIASLNGPFKWDKKTIELYAKWYMDPNNLTPIDDDKFVGYCSRRSLHLRKLSMIMSAARGNDMFILKEDFLKALSMLEATESKMPMAYGGAGIGSHSEALFEISQFIALRGSATKQQLIKKFQYSVLLDDLNKILQALELSGSIGVSIDSQGKTTYTWINQEEED